MKLIIDISQLTARPITGIGKVLQNLIVEFKKRDDLELIYFALTARGFLPKLREHHSPLIAPSLPARVSKFVIPIAQTVGLPIDLFTGPADASISVGSLCLPLRSGITISTIHDVFPLSNPEWDTKENIELFSKYLKSSEKNADLILTDSFFSKDEILKYTKIAENKILVAYPGVSELFKGKLPDTKLKKIKKEYQLPENFVLFVGSQVRRKNLERLSKSISIINQKTKEATYLILVGSKTDNMHFKDNEFIKETGFIPDEDLPYLYKLSKGLVYPSLAEGFGIPIIEAFTVEVPVLTSNNSSMKEIAKGAAILVDPYSVEDITRGLEDLLTLSDKRINKLVKEGKKRTKHFSYQISVDKIISEVKNIKTL